MNPAGNTLLVIDDEAVFRESLVAYLEDSGFRVLQAATSQSGLDLIKQHDPDVVISDLHMPKMDGLSLLKAIRESFPQTPVIVVSGAGVMSDVVDALRLGASDYLIKPILDLAMLKHSVSLSLQKLQLERDNLTYRENLEAVVSSLQESLAELQEDQRAGRQVQQKLLPESPLEIDGYLFDYHICPSLYLSGDFVDFIPLNNHSFGFYLADVSGHGASSAFVTILLKHMTFRLRSEYRARGGDAEILPSEILDSLNRGLLNTDLGKHVTMFGGIIDTKNNRLTYSLGGHFPLPILATDEKVEFLQGSGFPVGIFEEAEYENYVVELPDSFSLVTFSDGILELFPEQSLDDKEALLLSKVGGNRSLEAIKSAFKLDEQLEAPDDIAVMVLSRKVR